MSFLSPVYNESKNIEEMLRSLARQDYENWELLLADDGSTDSTASIINQAAANDERIIVVSDGVKLGKVRAFNQCFDRSTGDIIAILGGDDVLPPGALARRVQPFIQHGDNRLVAAFFKLRMFSDDRGFDDVVLPRGKKGSRSGPSLTLSRDLAQLLFPIPEQLPSEDIWLGEASEDVAEIVVDSKSIVVNYRVHAGNSNPRHKSFESMSESISLRTKAFKHLLETDRFELSNAKRDRLTVMLKAEQMRYDGRTLALLCLTEIPLVDRLAKASMSSRLLFRIRSRFYAPLSGHRGR